MKFNTPALLALIGISLTLSAFGAQKIYKWVDENGKTHYSDKPPPSKQDSESIEIQSKAKTNVKPESAVSAQERINSANKWLNSSRQRRNQSNAEKEAAYQQQKQREKNCLLLKNKLAEYQRADILYDKDEYGNVKVLNQDQRKQLVSEIKAGIQSNCRE